MRTARKYILLAAIGQTACSAGIRLKEPAATEVSGVKFLSGKPPLPDGLDCLNHPLLRYWHVSSKYRDPKHPFVPGNHSGVDFPAPVGTPVLALTAGKVAHIDEVAPGKDAYVSIRFDAKWTFSVHHLSRVDVKLGQEVERGELLGLSGGAVGADGSGPWTTGPHLHLNLANEGAFVDALPYLCP